MQTSIYIPKWLKARIPDSMPRGALSLLVQEALIQLFPKPSLVKHWNEDLEKAEEAMVIAKVKALREAL